MNNKITLKLTLTVEEFNRLKEILHDTAVDLEDDGRDGNPDAKLLWKLIKLLPYTAVGHDDHDDADDDTDMDEMETQMLNCYGN